MYVLQPSVIPFTGLLAGVDFSECCLYFGEYSGVILFLQVTDRHEKSPTSALTHDAFKTFYAIRIPRGGFSQYSSSPFAKSTLRSDDVKTGAGQFYREKFTRVFIPTSLWSLKTCEGDSYIYVVIEHQSTPDAHMAFRLMRYATAAIRAIWMLAIKRYRAGDSHAVLRREKPVSLFAVLAG